MARLWTLALLCLILVVPSTAQAKVQWHKQGASVFTDAVGQRDKKLWSVNSIAELRMGTAMGGLPFGAKLRIHSPKTGRTVTAWKLDIGAGGGDVFGRIRAVDIHCRTLRALGLNDCRSWTGLVLWRRVR